MSNKSITKEQIHHKIYKLRGMIVMLDRDLGEFYGEETRRINEVRKRNENNFNKLTFQITKEEYEELSISQGSILPPFRGGHLPWVYTERGAYKLSIYLTSERAEAVSDLILDAFFLVRDSLINPQAGRDLQILRSQIESLEQDLKGSDLVINNYFAPVNIFSSISHTVNNDLELIGKLMQLKDHAPDEKVAKSLNDAAVAVREKDKGKIKKSMETINSMLDGVTKGQAAYNVLAPAYEMLKLLF